MIENQLNNSNYELVPPDGGWGWCVLFGAMLVNILIPGTIKSFGVLFVEFMEVFHVSAAAASWIPALCYFLYSSLGPVSSILSETLSYRTVTIIGGLFATTGMILCFWANSVTYLYVTYGIFVGTGAGLSFPPTVYIVTSYFERYRGLANGLCISGSALGSIILPPLLRYLLEIYGYRGTILILGGITLNVLVGAALFQPVENHLKKRKKCIEKIKMLDSSELNQQMVKSGTFQEFEKNQSFTKSASSATMQNFKSPTLLSQTRNLSVQQKRDRKISAPVQRSLFDDTVLNNEVCSTSALHSIPEKMYEDSCNFLTQSNLQTNRTPRKSPSFTSSFQYISTPFHGSLLSIQPDEITKKFNRNDSTNCPSIITNQTNKKKKLSSFFSLSLIKDPLYLIILISNSTNAISYTNFVILLPAYAISMNFDKSKAALLISVVSAFDLVGRIGGSALSDLGLCPKHWYFVGGLFCSGLALTFLTVPKSYSILCVFCGIFGLSSGVYVGVTAVIMADMLGTDRLVSSYGISLFVNGILQLIGPPICGLWFEQTQSYVSLFTTLGLILIFGSVIWLYLPYIKRQRRLLLQKSLNNNAQSC